MRDFSHSFIFRKHFTSLTRLIYRKVEKSVDIETAFRKYRGTMQQHIKNFCGDESCAKDAVSQAFCAALGNRATLAEMPEPAMRAWLYAAARNAAVDIKRKESRFAPLSDHDLPDKRQWDPSDRMTVEQLMRALPPELSLPVHMKYFQGMNATEIGQVCGIPPATVRTRLRKALSVMRQEMGM